MFQPLEWFVGLRYLRSRRRRGVVSFMSLASLLGIALGVAALIIILSVMNGLETETRTRLLSVSAHATIASRTGLPDWRAWQERLGQVPGVAGVAPYVMIEGMLAAGANLRPALVRGIDPEQEARVSEISDYLVIGSTAELAPGSHKIILGRVLALHLGVGPGDSVMLLVPTLNREGRMMPRYAAFSVAGIFEAGIQDNDANLAFIDLRDASELKGLHGAAQGVAVRLEDPLAIESFRAASAPVLDSGMDYSDWAVDHRNLFTAIHIEKMMMRIILMFIVAVAAFNIVASLMMVVIDKRKDIAILRTYGLEPRRVARIFLVQGATIGFVGTVLGIALGVVCALNIDVIVPWLEATFHFKIMPGDVYYVTRLPSEVHWFDVVTIPAAAFFVALLATLYPARRAASVAPAIALRYD
jgi:lipoprotein-releasing system permease protein